MSQNLSQAWESLYQSMGTYLVTANSLFRQFYTVKRHRKATLKQE